MPEGLNPNPTSLSLRTQAGSHPPPSHTRLRSHWSMCLQLRGLPEQNPLQPWDPCSMWGYR